MKCLYNILFVFLLTGACFARVSDKHDLPVLSKIVTQENGEIYEDPNQGASIKLKRRHKRRKKFRSRKRGM